MRVQVSTDVPVSASALWPYLTQATSIRRWRPEIESFEFTDDPPATGSGFHLHVREAGHLVRYTGEVLAWNPPTGTQTRVWGGSLPEECAIETAVEITDLIGRSSLTIIVEIDYYGRLFRLLTPLLTVLYRWQLNRRIRTLCRLLENDISAPE